MRSDPNRNKKLCNSTSKGTDQYQNGSSNLLTSFREQPLSTAQVGTLLLVEPLDHAYTGPLFILWEGLYRCFTNSVGALLAGCAGCRISLHRVYENPVRVLHGLCLYVPCGPCTRRIVSGFDKASFDLFVVFLRIKVIINEVGDCCLHSSHILFTVVVCEMLTQSAK